MEDFINDDIQFENADSVNAATFNNDVTANQEVYLKIRITILQES